MTSIKDVEKELSKFSESKLAREWYYNDIVKYKIAKGYDAWIDDIHDHKLHLTLKEYIETRIDMPELLE